MAAPRSLLLPTTVPAHKGPPNKCPSSPGLTYRSASLTVLQPQPRMAQLETLEAKMANIEVSLSTTPRRRKGASLGGSLGGSTPRLNPSKEPGARDLETLRTALQDRESVIQSLRVQLGLGRLSRTPGGTPLTEAERPAAEQRLQRLKADGENKRTAIRNIKTTLERLDITDNIDVRIRQAELEYALGREELELLTLAEEARTLQCRLERLERATVPKQDLNSIYSWLRTGMRVQLQAVQVPYDPERPRWSAGPRQGAPGLYVEWTLEGEALQRGDRLLEVNGKILTSRSREDLSRLLGLNSRASEVVVLRPRAPSPPRPQPVPQAPQGSASASHNSLKADNLRLTHRISYLEEQVRELQAKDTPPNSGGQPGAHVTSISITSPPESPPAAGITGEIEVFRRGSQVTTVLHGKVKPNHVTTTIISNNNCNGNNNKTNGYHNNNQQQTNDDARSIQSNHSNSIGYHGGNNKNNSQNFRSDSRGSHQSNSSRYRQSNSYNASHKHGSGSGSTAGSVYQHNNSNYIGNDSVCEQSDKNGSGKHNVSRASEIGIHKHGSSQSGSGGNSAGSLYQHNNSNYIGSDTVCEQSDKNGSGKHNVSRASEIGIHKHGSSQSGSGGNTAGSLYQHNNSNYIGSDTVCEQSDKNGSGKHNVSRASEIGSHNPKYYISSEEKYGNEYEYSGVPNGTHHVHKVGSNAVNGEHKLGSNAVNGEHKRRRSYKLTDHSEEQRVKNVDKTIQKWDSRSSKSLELDSMDCVDYTSEPLGSSRRPAPPKKPLRLSLHRARSLQTVTSATITTAELLNEHLSSKRPSKRTHHSQSKRTNHI